MSTLTRSDQAAAKILSEIINMKMFIIKEKSDGEIFKNLQTGVPYS